MPISSRTVFTASCDRCSADITGDSQEYATEQSLRQSLRGDGLLVEGDRGGESVFLCDDCRNPEVETPPTHVQKHKGRVVAEYRGKDQVKADVQKGVPAKSIHKASRYRRGA